MGIAPAKPRRKAARVVIAMMAQLPVRPSPKVAKTSRVTVVLLAKPNRVSAGQPGRVPAAMATMVAPPKARAEAVERTAARAPADDRRRRQQQAAGMAVGPT